MSSYFPDIKLDQGMFTYKDNVPVFIDQEGTLNYEVGKTQEQLLFLGMQFQKNLDAPALKEKDYQITLLKEESLKMRQLIKDNFLRDRKFQANLDEEIMGMMKMQAFQQGCLAQQAKDFQEMKSAFQKGVDFNAERTEAFVNYLIQENESLREQAHQLSHSDSNEDALKEHTGGAHN
ncbi:putative uncharacterized protein [Waddlia chondrophila 2032/99]|uniref:Uncharacterized protein n=2 Tax=Waddlia chondrophila TaxID=71667 RepID=D6YWX8_WADCW|nr:hypothetical protein [Waddlia chondrophila]ADI38639.1 conserved hypothetical protein [Waddlia chondrophila WSU 86-1044]CCB90743.1 putative uncharacterized protein [Waddlia chondrophila 2032/99]